MSSLSYIQIDTIYYWSKRPVHQSFILLGRELTLNLTTRVKITALQLFSVASKENTEIAQSHTRGIFIMGYSIFHCDSVKYDLMLCCFKMKYTISCMKVADVWDCAILVLSACPLHKVINLYPQPGRVQHTPKSANKSTSCLINGSKMGFVGCELQKVYFKVQQHQFLTIFSPSVCYKKYAICNLKTWNLVFFYLQVLSC